MGRTPGQRGEGTRQSVHGDGHRRPEPHFAAGTSVVANALRHLAALYSADFAPISISNVWKRSVLGGLDADFCDPILLGKLLDEIYTFRNPLVI